MSTQLRGLNVLIVAFAIQAAPLMAQEAVQTPRLAVMVELQGVPEPLIIPGPPGSNRMLTALVRGAEPDRVFLHPTCVQRGLPLTQVASGAWQINLDDKQVTAFLHDHSGGSFRVCVEIGDTMVESVALTYKLAWPAREFNFPWDHATLTVKQRSTKELADGALHITLDDITAGQVLLTLTGPNEESIVGTRSVSEGQDVRFAFSGKQYVLIIDRLTNLLVGDDFAEISIYRDAAWEGASIKRMIDHVAASNCTFVRNEQELTGEQFAQLLRAKLDFVQPPVGDMDRFIDEVASESSTTGRPYEVRCPNGESMSAAQWLRQHRQKPPCRTGLDKIQANAQLPEDAR